jgi:hypothetical protein
LGVLAEGTPVLFRFISFFPVQRVPFSVQRPTS